MKKQFKALLVLPLLSGVLSGCTAEIKITPTEEWEKQLLAAIERGETNFTLPDEITVNPNLILETKQPAVVPETMEVTYLKVNADILNIRSGASASTSALGQAVFGEYLPLYGESGNWYETRFLGKKAFVSKSYCSPVSFTTTKDDKIEAVLSVGYSLLGTPYVYGATRYHDGYGNRLSGFTTKEFDCSSFVQYIFYEGAGTLLATTTRGQVVQGSHVDTSDLKRGDLLYMTNDARINLSGVERIGHVAVYLGNNLMLHTSSDHAKIVSMTQKQWSYVLDIRRQG